MKGENCENVSVLDFWRTSKYLAGADRIPGVSGAKSDLWGRCYWLGFANRIERFLPVISLDRRIHYLQKIDEKSRETDRGGKAQNVPSWDNRLDHSAGCFGAIPFIWAGLMTMPLILYLGIMFRSFFDPSITVKCCEGPYFLTALDVMLLGGPYWPDKVFSILGVLIMVYSTVYLNKKRKHGLVTTGPYRLVRNPQYFGAILLW